MKLVALKDTWAVTITFGGYENWTLEKGREFLFGRVKTSNSAYTVVQSGLNFHIFETASILISDPAVHIYIDVSGSTSDRSARTQADITKLINNLREQHPNCGVFNFDDRIYPYDFRPSAGVGGGTSYEVVRDQVENQLSGEYHVYVITDGCHAPIKVKEPSWWTWFITPGGVVGSVPKGSTILFLPDRTSIEQEMADAT